jgi:hypothetical protein
MVKVRSFLFSYFLEFSKNYNKTVNILLYVVTTIEDGVWPASWFSKIVTKITIVLTHNFLAACCRGILLFICGVPEMF